MNQSNFNSVYPNIKIPQDSIVKFDVVIAELKLFEYVIVYVYLKNDKDETKDTKIYKIESSEYENWNDDKYLINLIKQKIQEV